MLRPWDSKGRRFMGVLLSALALLLAGCATESSSRGLLESAEADAFQELQEAGGLEDAARHPVGAALSVARASVLLGQLVQPPITGRSFGPRRALLWLLREVLTGGEQVEYAELKWRAERFGWLVVVRPDGYLVTALTGTPLQRQGAPRLVEGEWRVGPLAVGGFYFSRGGVFYPVNEALRRVDGPPLGELGLGRDPVNAALEGAQEAMGEMAVALAESLTHPIRTVEDLGQLPTTVARLIAASPEYFARYGGMSAEEQVQEAARLSTHVVLLFGGGEATVGRMGGVGAELPALALTAGGELVLSRAAAAGGTSAGSMGIPSVLHMAGSGSPKTGAGSGQVGTPSQTAPAKGPGRWMHKTPTTESEQALAYQEQITGRPAWYVYKVGEVEFDGFNGKELLEAKGASYKKFLKRDGSAQPWFMAGKGLDALLEQARSQSRVAKAMNLPLVWHVAEMEFATFLRKFFDDNELYGVSVCYTPLI